MPANKFKRAASLMLDGEGTSYEGVEGKLFHLIGLTEEFVLNPVQCKGLLSCKRTEQNEIENASNFDGTSQGENLPLKLPRLKTRKQLTELDWQNSIESMSSISDTDRPSLAKFDSSVWTCKCPVASIEQLYCPKLELQRPKFFNEEYDKTIDMETTSRLTPNKSEQIREFGCKFNRRKLLKLTNLSRRLRKYSAGGSRYYELCLYELEHQANQLNEWLAHKLTELARDDLANLILLLSTELIAGEDLEDFTNLNSELANLYQVPQRQLSRELSSASSTSSLTTPSLSLSNDSGVSLLVQTGDGTESSERRVKRNQKSRNRNQLKRHFALRSSRQFRNIIAFSWQLFNELLNESSFNFHSQPGQSLTLNQLKIFARVESQKLRAKLRFEWLAKCLWIAFDESASDQVESDRCSTLPPVEQSNGTIHQEGPNGATVHYLDAVSRLMGHLLRRHYLEEALDRWLASLEWNLQQPNSSVESTQAKLSLRVRLELGRDSSNEVATSRPEIELKETFAFVMDEISWACCELPRIECQQLEMPLDKKCKIEVLAEGDELLATKKRRMETLVSSMGSRDEIEAGNCSTSSALIGSGHKRLIDIVNKFRVTPNQLEAIQVDEHLKSHPGFSFKLEEIGAASLIGFELIRTKEGTESDLQSSPIENLELGCKQIRLLDQLEFELKCQLETKSSFGRLVELDLGPLNESLLKIVDKERLLLVRFKSDELFKLLEAIRKQLDELELNIDLESAIEDYLNERWRFKQSQQPNLEQQILLDDAPRAEEVELDQALDLRDGEFESELNHPDEAQLVTELADSDQQPQLTVYSREEELLNTLVNRNNPNVGHLFALGNPANAATNLSEHELTRGQSQVAPLIESRLLVEKYKFLNNFLEHELDSLIANLHFGLIHGLAYLCEFGWLQSWSRDEQESGLEAEQLELVAELSWRAREFGPVLSEALNRLASAYNRLLSSMQMRARVLDKSLLEFDWLMQKLSSCQLESSSDEAANIKQLDFIQDTASWSQKLSWRLDFLACQNEMIQRESSLLLVVCQREFSLFDWFHQDQIKSVQQTRPPLSADEAARLNEVMEEETQWRTEALEMWRFIANQINEFWLLTEEFETQQVKWLNSDTKRIDFLLIESSFELRFQNKLDQLRELVTRNNPLAESCSRSKSAKKTLLKNVDELQIRLETFRRRCLPILRFLTNQHLSVEHWRRLQQLIQGPEELTVASGTSSDQLQIYTTVAQLLELGVDEKLARLLDEMSHQATIEHELSQLIETETQRQSGQFLAKSNGQRPKSQLDLMEALNRLDSWNEQELVLAASRFIKTRWRLAKGSDERDSALESKQLLIDQLAQKLVAFHTAVKQLVRLSGQLNLDMTSSESSLARIGPELARSKPGGRCLVFVHSKLTNSSQQVDASLLIEFLRLFTESWLEADRKVTERVAKVEAKLGSTRKHLAEISRLLHQVGAIHAGDSKLAICQNELELARLQRASLKLELERELLATSESSSLELHSEALRRRDICIKQICERAIPAIRAATRALDCLGDGRSLRTLRSYRPSPPLAIRLVMEAVCLLRNVCCNTTEPGRRSSLLDTANTRDAGDAKQFNLEGEHRLARALEEAADQKTATTQFGRENATKGRDRKRCLRPVRAERHYDQMRDLIVEDYWPIAWRTLNGTHSSQFIDDLRRVSQATRIPTDTMRHIRRKYLARAEFQLGTIERHSREAGQLARWLLAVDLLERVISVVRPNYDEYLKANKTLASALTDVAERRSQIEQIGCELQQMEDSIGRQTSERSRLVDLIDDCLQGSKSLAKTRDELAACERQLVMKLVKLQTKLQTSAEKSLKTSAKLVYLDSLPSFNRSLIECIFARELGPAGSMLLRNVER